MRICSILAAVAATALVSSAALAAPITFTSGTFTSNSVLTMVGPTTNVLYGVDIDGGGATTANGYVFGADNGTNVTAGFPNTGNWWMPGTSGDANFDSILNTAKWGTGGDQVVTLNGLTSGTSYNVLALFVDARDIFGTNNRSMTVTATNTISQQYTFGGSPIGAYVLGTFTADAATQTFTLTSANDPVFNAVLVADAVPEPASLSLLGLGAIGLLSRRRATKA